MCTMVTKDRQHMIGKARPGSPGINYQRLISNRADGEPPLLLSNRAVRSDGRDQAFFSQNQSFYSRVTGSYSSKTDIDAPSRQRFGLLDGHELNQLQIQIGIVFA